MPRPLLRVWLIKHNCLIKSSLVIGPILKKMVQKIFNLIIQKIQTIYVSKINSLVVFELFLKNNSVNQITF